MKGTIMAQRVLIATCLMMAAACLGMVGLVWSQSGRSGAEAAEANRRLAEMLNQTHATNQEMLRQLQAMSKPAPPAKSQEWIPASLKLTLEKPDGPPAVAFEAWLGRGQGGSSKEGAIHRLSDSDGLLDFGVIQPGDWEYRIESTGSSTLYWKLTGSLNALPGTPVTRQVTCPKVPPELASVHLKIDWPSGLENKDLRAVALFERHGTRYQPPLRWGLWNSKQGGWQRRQVIIGLPSNQHSIDVPYSVNNFASPFIWRFRTEAEKKNGMSLYALPLGSEPTPETESSSDPAQLFVNLPADWLPQAPEQIDFEMGEYSLERLLILQPHADPKTASGWHSFLVVGLIQAEGNSTFFSAAWRQADGLLQPLAHWNASPLAVSETYWRNVWGRFSARPGQVNEWTIPLPDELVKSIRGKLKPESTSTERLGLSVRSARP